MVRLGIGPVTCRKVITHAVDPFVDGTPPLTATWPVFGITSMACLTSEAEAETEKRGETKTPCTGQCGQAAGEVSRRQRRKPPTAAPPDTSMLTTCWSGVSPSKDSKAHSTKYSMIEDPPMLTG